ncbi:hypothetical protein Tco_1466524 [Tanacetum coccineum]
MCNYTHTIFPPRRTAKLRNDIFMFQQHQDESLYDSWTRFKDLLQKVPQHDLDLWLQVQIFYDHVDFATQMAIDYVVGGRLRKLRPEEAWETIKDLDQHEEEELNAPIFSEKESPDYIDAILEQELESMECRVESLIRNEVLLEYEVFSTWMAFGGNTQRRDGIAGFKRCRCDLSSDGVMDLTMASERSRPKETLEDSAS